MFLKSIYYRHLQDKADLSAKEQAELDKLTAFLTNLPTGGRSNRQSSDEHTQLLRKIEKELQDGRASVLSPLN